MRSPYVFAAAAAVAVVGAADPAPVVVYETYIDCSSTTSGMATMTNMMTETNCPHCTGGNPPMPTGPTTVYTTAYKEFCSCSDIYTDKTYTVTESCSSPGAPRPSDHVPQGFQVTTATCHVCAETPVVATLTTPAPKAPSAGPADSAPAPAAAAPTGAGSSPAAAPGSGSPPPAGGAAPAGSRAGSSPDSPASPGGSAPAGGAMPMSPAGTGSSPAGGAMPMSPADTGSSPAGGAMPMSPAGAGSAPAGGEMPMSPAGDAGSAPGSPPGRRRRIRFRQGSFLASRCRCRCRPYVPRGGKRITINTNGRRQLLFRHALHRQRVQSFNLVDFGMRGDHHDGGCDDGFRLLKGSLVVNEVIRFLESFN
ncbi:MAG: hypothetical protein LQ344_000317 [Seirophora lacunosa]|nr:MAG: hypothetical protein LQ344_000317 [Seirophora lacunosa]